MKKDMQFHFLVGVSKNKISHLALANFTVLEVIRSVRRSDEMVGKTSHSQINNIPS